jgi:hypothetical protein
VSYLAFDGGIVPSEERRHDDGCLGGSLDAAVFGLDRDPGAPGQDVVQVHRPLVACGQVDLGA